MATSPGLLNPYQSVPTERISISDVYRAKDGVNCYVRRGWLSRRIRVSGLMEAEIHWDARSAMEFVRVNGRVAAHKMAFFYVPMFHFRFRSGEQMLTGRIEVCVRFLFFLKSFRLFVNDELIYEE